MTIIAFLGSPRPRGNTDTLAEAVLDGARSAGCATESFALRSLRLHPCTGCGHCGERGRHCILRDDGDELYRSVIRADVLLFVTPVYWYGPTAIMKAFLDRLVVFNTPDARPLVRGKAAGVVAAWEERGPEAAEPMVKLFELGFRYLELRHVGSLLVDGAGRAHRPGLPRGRPARRGARADAARPLLLRGRRGRPRGGLPARPRCRGMHGQEHRRLLLRERRVLRAGDPGHRRAPARADRRARRPRRSGFLRHAGGGRRGVRRRLRRRRRGRGGIRAPARRVGPARRPGARGRPDGCAGPAPPSRRRGAEKSRGRGRSRAAAAADPVLPRQPALLRRGGDRRASRPGGGAPTPASTAPTRWRRVAAPGCSRPAGS